MKVIPIIGNDNSFLYRFLVSSRFRVARHITVIVALLVIACNLVLFSCQGYIEMWGSGPIFLSSHMFLLYGSIFYFNFALSCTRYLLKQRYLTYILFLSTALIVVFIFQATQEYIVSDIFSVPNIYVDTLKCICDGLSFLFPINAPQYHGRWHDCLTAALDTENQRVMQLEKIRLQSEIEHLKEQISPSMLFRVLHYSGEQALVNPGKASKMLMKLSQILRYQLYDCNREKVLLHTEIKFLTNYLELEQLVSGKFDFHMNASGETGRTFVFPLLFIPFIQYTVKQIETQEEHPASIDIHLHAEDENIQFNCQVSIPCLEPEQELNKIRQRLDLQYGENYRLELTGQSIQLELKGGGK